MSRGHWTTWAGYYLVSLIEGVKWTGVNVSFLFLNYDDVRFQRNSELFRQRLPTINVLPLDLQCLLGSALTD